jgi:UPF0271 protein
MSVIALNADVGEGFDDEPLYAHLDQANIACGGHAGDERSMRLALARCVEHGVQAGAHPSFPDRAGFGRKLPERLDVAALGAELVRQVESLHALAEELGTPLTHIKLHGALYNRCAADAELSLVIANLLREEFGNLQLVWLAGSPGWAKLKAEGFPVRAEGFVDRGYRADGTLIPRTEVGALIQDPEQAARQALRLAHSGAYETLCVHSDSPGAAQILSCVRARLRV